MTWQKFDQLNFVIFRGLYTVFFFSMAILCHIDPYCIWITLDGFGICSDPCTSGNHHIWFINLTHSQAMYHDQPMPWHGGAAIDSQQFHRPSRGHKFSPLCPPGSWHSYATRHGSSRLPASAALRIQLELTMEQNLCPPCGALSSATLRFAAGC